MGPPESFNCPGESSGDESGNGTPPPPVSSPAPDSGGSNSGDGDEENCQQLNLELFTDKHAAETSWALLEKESGVLTTVGSGPPTNFVYSDSKLQFSGLWMYDTW